MGSRSGRLSVQVRGELIETVARDALRCMPRECCGVLAGTARRIDHAWSCRNVAEHEARFEIDPLDLLSTHRRAERMDLAIVGFYHSHVDASPIPSELDRSAPLWPDLPPFLHLVHSPRHGSRLYDTRGRRWTPVEMDVI